MLIKRSNKNKIDVTSWYLSKISSRATSLSEVNFFKFFISSIDINMFLSNCLTFNNNFIHYKCILAIQKITLVDSSIFLLKPFDLLNSSK